MHAVQSALAIRRERERRQSLKANKGRKASTNSLGSPTLPAIPSEFRSTQIPTNGTFNYTTVGVSFIVFGSLMMIPVFGGGSEALGLDWHHLLGMGGLLISVGILMVIVQNFITGDEAEEFEDENKLERMAKYISSSTGGRLGRSASQNPIIEDVEYGIDSRRSSLQLPAKNFEQPAAADALECHAPPKRGDRVVKV